MEGKSRKRWARSTVLRGGTEAWCRVKGRSGRRQDVGVGILPSALAGGGEWERRQGELWTFLEGKRVLDGGEGTRRK